MRALLFLLLLAGCTHGADEDDLRPIPRTNNPEISARDPSLPQMRY